MSREVKAAGGRPRTADVVTSRGEMAELLFRRRRFFSTYVRKRLPAGVSDDVIEETLDRVGEKAMTAASIRPLNGSAYVCDLLRKECARKVLPRLAEPPQPEPVDRRLGRLVGPVLDAVRRLSPGQQRVIWKLARERLTYREIAEQEGVTEAAIRARAHYARRNVLNMLSKAPALLMLSPRRVRTSVVRLAAELTSPSVATTALLPLVALFATSAPTVTLPGTFRPPSRSAPVTLAAVAGPAQAAPKTPTLHATEVGAIVVVPTTSSRPLAVAGGTAATETPEDVTLTAIAAPADGRPVLVAIGRGNTCNCSVLMQSMDGGATWEATGGPPADVNQLAVPPTYPSDPRIFGGVSPGLGGAPYMAAAFRQPFKHLSNLPPGQLAVSAHFDAGDPRLFSASQTAIWSIRVGDTTQATPHDEVDYSAAAVTSGTVSVLATPAPSPGGPAVLAWVPALATVPGSAYAAVDSAVMQCPVASACTVLSDLAAVTPWHLVMRGTSVVLAYSQSAAYLSRDGGGSFVAVALPRDVGAIASMTTASRDDSLWASVRLTSGGTDVRRIPSGGEWIDAAGNSTAARTQPGLLLAVGDDRLIEEFSSLGYRCTSAQTIAWTPRCPST